MKIGKHLLFLGGLGSLGYGCYLFSHALGFIVSGLLIIVLSFLLDAQSQRKPQ